MNKQKDPSIDNIKYQEILIERVIATKEGKPVIMVHGVRINKKSLKLRFYPIFAYENGSVTYSTDELESVPVRVRGSDIQPDVKVLSDTIGKYTVWDKDNGKYWFMYEGDIFYYILIQGNNFIFTRESENIGVTFSFSNDSYSISTYKNNERVGQKRKNDIKITSSVKVQYTPKEVNKPCERTPVEIRENRTFMKFYGSAGTIGILFNSVEKKLKICLVNYNKKFYCHSIVLNKKFVNIKIRDFIENECFDDIVKAIKVETNTIYETKRYRCISYMISVKNYVLCTVMIIYNLNDRSVPIRNKTNIEIIGEKGSGRRDIQYSILCRCHLTYETNKNKFTISGDADMVDYIDQTLVKRVRSENGWYEEI